MSMRILLADDHLMMRQGLRALLETQPGMEVVGEAENGRIAVRLAHELVPQVVVMDVMMPDLNGVEATRQIVLGNPGVKVIALSMRSEKQFVAKMLEAGASGYLVKGGDFEELIEAIHAVTSGRAYLSAKVAGAVVNDYVRRLQEKSPAYRAELTPREREVLQLVAEGHTTKKIASKLNVSAKTIETHRRNIMAKLNIDSVAELTKYAIREGITSLRE